MTGYARWARAATLVGYLGLIALLLAWLTLLAPPPPSVISLTIVLLVGPLLFPLRGLLKGRRYTHAWSSLLSLLYFVHGVANAPGGGPETLLGSAEIALSLLFFAGAVSYVRLTREEPSETRLKGR